MTKIHHVSVGGGTLILLRDGHVQLGAELFSGVSAADASRIFRAAGLGDGPASSCVNAFLYQTPDRTVLIDAGGAGIFPELGALRGLLAKAGISPDDIDTVFCTHLHPDHIGGLMNGTAPVFGKATLWLHQDELAFWGNQDIADAAPCEAKPFFKAAQNVIFGYQDRLHVFSGETECAPGAVTVPLPGHTPGHCGLQIGSPDTGVLIWGDIIHIEALQLAIPAASIAFDVNPDLAVATRKTILARVARDGRRVAGGHLSEPGLGQITSAEEGYVFQPAKLSEHSS
jgi:glyoxylase-like metal-dependent hydrolase (beta-lactamase superfamily II)